MNLTPEQRQKVIDAVGTIIALNERSGAIELYDADWVSLVKEISDAAINAILSLSSPPCAEVVPEASDGAPSQIKNDPANYKTRAANRENFTEDGTGYFVWDKAPEKGPSQSCKWIKTHGWEASCDQSSIYFIGDWWKFCPRCGKPLEVVE